MRVESSTVGRDQCSKSILADRMINGRGSIRKMGANRTAVEVRMNSKNPYGPSVLIVLEDRPKQDREIPRCHHRGTIYAALTK